MGSKNKPFDLIKRGNTEPSPLGTATFVGLRLLDIPIQYAILHPNGLGVRLLTRLGLDNSYPLMQSMFPQGLPFIGQTTGIPAIDELGLAVIPVLFSAACAMKHVFWILCTCAENFPLVNAVSVAGYNTFLDSLNALLFLCAATTSLNSRPLVPSTTMPLSQAVAIVLFTAGLAIETTAEVQRKHFKDRRENKGKVCKIGLWRWARHINYLGYAMWRGAYCMIGTGWVGGLVMGLMQGYDLSTRAASVLDAYCQERYGAQWTQFKREVPWRIVPGVY